MIAACAVLPVTGSGCAATAASPVASGTAQSPALRVAASTLLPTVPATDPSAAPATSAAAPVVPGLYENPGYGLCISTVPGWSLQEVAETTPLKLVFGNGKIQAILSFLPPDKTDATWIGDLLLGLGDVEILSRKDAYLDVRSRSAASIRTVARILRTGEYACLLVLVTPEDGIEQRTADMDAFLSGVSLSR